MVSACPWRDCITIVHVASKAAPLALMRGVRTPHASRSAANLDSDAIWISISEGGGPAASSPEGSVPASASALPCRARRRPGLGDLASSGVRRTQLADVRVHFRVRGAKDQLGTGIGHHHRHRGTVRCRGATVLRQRMVQAGDRLAGEHAERSERAAGVQEGRLDMRAVAGDEAVKLIGDVGGQRHGAGRVAALVCSGWPRRNMA